MSNFRLFVRNSPSRSFPFAPTVHPIYERLKEEFHDAIILQWKKHSMFTLTCDSRVQIKRVKSMIPVMIKSHLLI